MKLGCAELGYRVHGELVRRATPDSQGCLAALQLWHMENPTEPGRFPADVDLMSLIESADFSLAPSRAAMFWRRLDSVGSFRDAFIGRLLYAFDGHLTWRRNSFLITYLLTIATLDQLSPRISQIVEWLNTHPDQSWVRTKYLSFLAQLPAEFSRQRADFALQTVDWLATHPHRALVRMQFLSFLLQHPAEFSRLRAYVAQETANWLATHPHNTSVRTMFLSFLLRLPGFPGLRRDAARQTAKWLEEHGEDTSVRTQYLSFLLKLPVEFSDMRADAARQTANWLEEHLEGTSVRANYLSFLLNLPTEFSDLRADTAGKTARWLTEHIEDTRVRSEFVIFLAEMKPVGEWQQLASRALNDEWISSSDLDTKCDTRRWSPRACVFTSRFLGP